MDLSRLNVRSSVRAASKLVSPTAALVPQGIAIVVLEEPRPVFEAEDFGEALTPSI